MALVLGLKSGNLLAQFLIKLKPRLASFVALAKQVEHIPRMMYERLPGLLFDVFCHGVAPFRRLAKGQVVIGWHFLVQVMCRHARPNSAPPA